MSNPGPSAHSVGIRISRSGAASGRLSLAEGLGHGETSSEEAERFVYADTSANSGRLELGGRHGAGFTFPAASDRVLW